MSKVKFSHFQIQVLLIAALFVISLCFRLVLSLPTQFDGLYGQDAYAYYDYAQSIRNSLHSATALPPFFWPLGYPALIALVQTIVGTQPSTAQFINVLLGASLSPLVYQLARELGINHFGGVAAALIMAVCGQALQSSIVIMSDIPALFWAALSALSLVRYLRLLSIRPSPSWLILASITLMIAVITRWLYILLGIPFALTLLVAWRGRIHWRTAGYVLLAVSLVYLPQFIFSHTNPAPTLNHQWVEGWAPANIINSSFTNVDGHFDYEKPNALYYAQPYYDDYYLSPLLTIFVVIGLWGMYQRGIWKLILIASWALLPYLFLAGIPYQNIRFSLIVVPAVALLAGSGLETTTNFFRRIKPKRISFNVAQPLFTIILLIGLGQMWVRANAVIRTFITSLRRGQVNISPQAKLSMPLALR